MKEIKAGIKESIQAFAQGSLSETSLALFNALGYNTKRQSPLDKKTYQGFQEAYLDGAARFNEDKALVRKWKYIDLLFQLSKDEITTRHGLFDTRQVDRAIIETYLFFVIELSKDNYSRTALSHITREINKVFPMPVMVLFKHGQALTLAVINRRLHKRDEQKDVLEKVTLIKDIHIGNPHRAHIEILFDLSFEELLREHKFTNFVELHNAWQKTLDTKELNKKFYKELSNWYFWAMKEVDFPGAAPHADKNSLFKDEDKEREHNAKNLIRLLTRLLFVWFVKEKGLIPEELFDEKYVANELLLNFRPKKGTGAAPKITSSYYRAILQNLFFATLNQTMGKREFRKSGQNMNVTNLMRYERYFKDSKKFIQVVERIVPFMNGGLFECLDMPDPGKKGRQGGDVIIYLDGFSDRDDNPLMVPDYIFFGTEDHVDLSEAYGDKAKEYKNAAVKGLINILKSYKFTVAENTPLEEEVALDPELLGRVFENLLASYNPETKTTARKQTGSFYTPREIVNYMVDESLLAYLKQKLEDGGIKDKEDSLRDLISYSETPNSFNPVETKLLIAAIDNCKILDPACGSGAFPMGILHKLVHVLHKLDPQNALWKQKQIEKAQSQDDVAIRDQLISDIEEAFENNELDYGRKLYLIENCIYGVDIQPIATQISKLRFFISLIVDQKVNTKKDNFGIRPLPNLETKFVAANTLIGIEKPKAQMSFGSAEVKTLEEQLKDVRHRLFSAKTPGTKRKFREEDKALREQMGDLLIKSGWENQTARQLAAWDPYDQNASSSFFDLEWMFGLTDGFDVVIGNPPYFNINTIDKDFIKYLSERYKIIHTGYNDIVYYFIFLGIELLKKTGCSVFIASNYFLGNEYANKLRRHLSKHASKIVNFKEYMVFDAASVHTCISISHKEPKSDEIVFHETTSDNRITSSSIEDELKSFSIKRRDLNDNWLIANQSDSIILENLKVGSVLLGDISIIEKGSTSGKNEVFTIPFNFAKEMKLEDSILRKNIKNGDIDRYTVRDRGNLLIYVDSHTHIESYPKIFSYLKAHKDVLLSRNEVKQGLYPWYRFERPRNKTIFDSGEKIVVPYRAENNRFAYDSQQYFNDGGDIRAIVINDDKLNIKYVLAILNSKLIDWFYGFIGKPKGKVREYFNAPLSLIPIKKISLSEQQPFIAFVDSILYAKYKNSDADASFFERLIDAMVYELYLPAEIKAAGCEVLKHLTNLPELKDDWSDEKKLAVIEKVYKELSDPKHPVSIAMEWQKTVKEVRIIEGLPALSEAEGKIKTVTI